MNFLRNILIISFIVFSVINQSSCNFITHRTLSADAVVDSLNNDPEPNYDISLDNKYQDFTSYLYMGNRIENFTSYFNTYFKADQDYEDAMVEYRATLISEYSRRLDSLGITPPVSASVKEKLDKSIERASKIIQFHKNSRYIDNAVLLIGKSYYFLGDYFNAERKFNEFISKLSSSENADEAILFLGRTKIKLGKRDEGETILKTLLKNSTDNEVKSLAVRDLGIQAFNKGNIDDAIIDFKSSIELTGSNERKAEGQYILAKILSQYKPEQTAAEYRKVLDYTSDFDLTFFASLNSAKGLIYNKQFSAADEMLTSLRKKYREVPEYTQLVDLEIANSLYGQNKIRDAKEKYYEVIVKYPGTVASSDAYYFLGKHEEVVNQDYLNALVNYRKSASENSSSEFYTDSSKKASTFDRYFILLGEIKDTTAVIIPSANPDVEKYRVQYNEEKGIEQKLEENNNGDNGNPRNNPPPPDDGNQNGKGKGKSGGAGSRFTAEFQDSLKENNPSNSPSDPTGGNPVKGNKNNVQNRNKVQDDTSTVKESESELRKIDSLKAINEELKIKENEQKKFNSYYELAEIFMYNLSEPDSAEYYLKIILLKFTDSQNQCKALYTLANFYKNNGRKDKSDETFSKIVSTYPNTVYAYESRKILGLKTNEEDVSQTPKDEIFSKAFNLYNEKKYSEAVMTLSQFESKYPQDSSVAKALYGIGFIYENGLINKDSSVFYYKKVVERYPASEFAARVAPKLEYIASLEVKDTTSSDTLKKITGQDSVKINPESNQPSENKEEIKQENPEEVQPQAPDNSQENNGENKLSQEEIDRLLKETNPENAPGK